MSLLDLFGRTAVPWTGYRPARFWPVGGPRRLAVWVGKIGGVVLLTGIVLGSAAMMVGSSGSAERPAAPPASWVEVNRPIQLYGLAGTEFSKLPLLYRARRHAVGGGREDVLTFGDLRHDQPFLELVLYRIGSEATDPMPFPAALDDLGRRQGMRLSGLGSPAVLTTRFGDFETADVRLAQSGAATPCLAFRTAEAQSAVLRIAGFVCGAAEKPTGRAALRCVIDRLDLDSAGDDTGLRNVFVEAERRRGGECAPLRPTAAGSKTTWLAANSSLPPLKGPLIPGGLRR